MFYDFPCTFSTRVCVRVSVCECMLLSVCILPAHFCMQRPQLLPAQVPFPLPLATPIPLRQFSFSFPGLRRIVGFFVRFMPFCILYIYLCRIYVRYCFYGMHPFFHMPSDPALIRFSPPLTTFLFFAIRIHIPIFIPISIWPTWSEIQGWTGSRIGILVGGVWEVCVSECATCVCVGAAFSCGTWLQIMAHGATGGERRVSIISPILTSVSLSLSLCLSVSLCVCCHLSCLCGKYIK